MTPELAPEARCAAIVLAAGASLRLGSPKQLLVFEGRTLLRRAAEAAVECGASPVVVVLGHQAERLEGELTGLSVERVVNEDFAAGLATSIRTGLARLAERSPSVAGVLLLPCDQPLVSAALLAELLSAFHGPPGPAGPPLVACRYAGVLGPPALFPARCFAELAALTGDRGARAVLEQHRDAVVAIDFPGGELDLDTPEDYARLIARASSSRPR